MLQTFTNNIFVCRITARLLTARMMLKAGLSRSAGMIIDDLKLGHHAIAGDGGGTYPMGL